MSSGEDSSMKMAGFFQPMFLVLVSCLFLISGSNFNRLILQNSPANTRIGENILFSMT